MDDKYISISQLTRYIKYKIDNDINLQEVFIKGEISNFKAHSRGHFYFTLKDDESRLGAIMFASSAKNIKFEPQDGMSVLVTGKISVYPATGNYQIYVSDMIEDGVGNLYVAYEQLKKKLEQEGLFDKSHKKQIPKIPNRVGVVTAPTGAAIRDITSTIKRRWPICEVILFPALVQGETAKDSVAKQIKKADQFGLDVLIVGRGGGSIEDLWCFNEEIVAREIYNAKTPIISAVGHEVDFTIADFVADMRAPTPTGAAEIAVPNITDVINYINQLNIRINKVIQNILDIKSQKLMEIMSRHIFKDPIAMYEVKEQKFSNILDRLNYNIKNIYNYNINRYEKIKESIVLKQPEKILDNYNVKYNLLISKLEIMNPILTLKRGYTITRGKDKIISSKKNIKVKDKIEKEFTDGKINVEVI